jgi:glucokinase
MLLAGDIGGTKTELAVYSAERGPRAPIAQRRFASGDYPGLAAIARQYLTEVDLPVTHASFAVAGPVDRGAASLTNLPWDIEESALQRALGLEVVSLLNDVQAMATAVPHLGPGEVQTLQEGEGVPGGAIAVIAPGTGLGQAFLTWDGYRYRAHPSEGSHVDFAPLTAREAELLRYLEPRWGRVSYERVCAGRGIPDLYDFLKDQCHVAESPAVRSELDAARDRTPAIVSAALARPPDPLCLATLNMFAEILGAQAGNLVLTVLATGGLYIGGGIPQRALPMVSSRGQVFLSTFSKKGRLSPLLRRVPVHVIIEPIALLGAAIHGLDLPDISENTRAPSP